ncbi:MAG: transporter associated domain-containing protein [Alphaproteobacteria bacterium]
MKMIKLPNFFKKKNTQSPLEKEASSPLLEEELFANILKFKALQADDIMVPRGDMIAIEISTPFTDLLRLIGETKRTRYPVFKETLDHIVGTIHIKDLIAEIGEATENKTLEKAHDLSKIMRKVSYVSPSMNALDLLDYMRIKKSQIVLVVDEFGGVDGLVTTGGLIARMFEKLDIDEPQDDDDPIYIENEDGTITVDAGFDLAELSEAIGHSFNVEEEYQEIDTIGGYVFSIAVDLPARGEVIKEEDSEIEFEILEVSKRRIKKICIRNLPQKA